MQNEFFTENGEFIGKLPNECVLECSANGNVERAVSVWKNKLNFTVPYRKDAEDFLLEFGAWSESELRSKTDSEIDGMILWIICNEIKETGEFFGI